MVKNIAMAKNDWLRKRKKYSERNWKRKDWTTTPERKSKQIKVFNENKLSKGENRK